MDESNHWTTVVKCSLCSEIPRTAPLFHCPYQHHQYCINCFSDLRKCYRGYAENGATCVICKFSGQFLQSKINTDFLNKIRTKPGIGRPYRYSATEMQQHYQSRTHTNEPTKPKKENITVEGLFQLPADQVRRLLNPKDNSNDPVPSQNSIGYEENKQIPSTSAHHLLPHQSKVPMKCPIKGCMKVVAPQSFVTHFKYEHSTIPKYSIERGKEICLPCDVSVIEHNHHLCLAMIIVYEINKIDVRKSQSTQSVIKTCGKFSQQVPIDSFWLMATGSPEKRPCASSVMFWLFCPSEENYQNTIELSSKNDTAAVSTYCPVHNSYHKLEFEDIAGCLNCLLLNRSSLCNILQEGPQLNLRITVH